MAVVNGEIRSSLIVQPEDGQIPYSPAGRMQLQQALQRIMTPPEDPEQNLLGGRCIVGFGSTGGPPMLPGVKVRRFNNQGSAVPMANRVA